MKKKLWYGILVVIVLFTACEQENSGNSNTNKGNMQDSVSANSGSGNEANQNDRFAAFIGQFPERNIPFIFDNALDPESPKLSSEDQFEFLKRSTEDNVAYGNFPLSKTHVCLVTVEKPLDEVRFVTLNIFTSDGNLTYHREIAGNDGSKLDAWFREDGVIEIVESPSEVNGLSEANQSLWTINEAGVMMEHQE